MARSELIIAPARQHHVLIKDNSPLSNIISIITRLINKCFHFKMFSGGLLLGGHKCLCATSKIRQFTRVILFLVNSDHKFAHSDVSIILDSLGITITSC